MPAELTYDPGRRGPMGDLIGRGLAFVLLVASLLFGGLGPHEPLLTGALEALAFVVLAYQPIRYASAGPASAGALTAALLVLATLVAGVGQLIPLAPQVWRALPGRTLLAEIMDALGRGWVNWPISLSPSDTRDALLFLLPPVALFFAVLLAPEDDRRRLAWLVPAVAVLGAITGLLQFAGGDGFLIFSPVVTAKRYPGLFANINHQAAMLACGAAILLGLLRGPARSGAFAIVGWGALGVLAGGIVITSSRAGLLLALIVASVGLAWHWKIHPQRAGSTFGIGKRLLVALATAVALIAAGTAFGQTYWGRLMLARLGTATGDGRFEYWDQTVAAFGAYSPIGSGLGTFQIVYQARETLERTTPTYVNHAHNDYLEIALEMGVAGCILLAAALAWLALLTRGALRQGPGEAGQLARSGAVVIWLLLLHSLVDYPLRTEALASLFAFACAVTLPTPTRAGRDKSVTTRR